MKVYGECPFCYSTNTRSVRTSVDPLSVPATAWDHRHCDDCDRDYADYWELRGDDQCEVWE